jgi:hypothetical protein
MGNSKDNFIFTIEALKRQLDYDKTYSKTATKLFDAEDMPMYNNGILVQTLISGLCNYFEDIEEANREICSYMYELDFGRCQGADLIGPEDLYDRIIGDAQMNFSYLQVFTFPESDSKVFNPINLENKEPWKKVYADKKNDINPLGNLYPTNNNHNGS